MQTHRRQRFQSQSLIAFVPYLILHSGSITQHYIPSNFISILFTLKQIANL